MDVSLLSSPTAPVWAFSASTQLRIGARGQLNNSKKISKPASKEDNALGDKCKRGRPSSRWMNDVRLDRGVNECRASVERLPLIPPPPLVMAVGLSSVFFSVSSFACDGQPPFACSSNSRFSFFSSGLRTCSDSTLPTPDEFGPSKRCVTQIRGAVDERRIDHELLLLSEDYIKNNTHRPFTSPASTTPPAPMALQLKGEDHMPGSGICPQVLPQSSRQGRSSATPPSTLPLPSPPPAAKPSPGVHHAQILYYPPSMQRRLPVHQVWPMLICNSIELARRYGNVCFVAAGAGHKPHLATHRSVQTHSAQINSSLMHWPYVGSASSPPIAWEGRCAAGNVAGQCAAGGARAFGGGACANNDADATRVIPSPTPPLTPPRPRRRQLSTRRCAAPRSPAPALAAGAAPHAPSPSIARHSARLL
ncbi:Protein of unknown function [Gryllus bimaculatus]|nr:Protein of unknown function [Gryllus bimaculatus]